MAGISGNGGRARAQRRKEAGVSATPEAPGVEMLAEEIRKVRAQLELMNDRRAAEPFDEESAAHELQTWHNKHRQLVKETNVHRRENELERGID